MDRTDVIGRFIVDNAALRQQLEHNMAQHRRILAARARNEDARRTSSSASGNSESLSSEVVS